MRVPGGAESPADAIWVRRLAAAILICMMALWARHGLAAEAGTVQGVARDGEQHALGGAKIDLKSADGHVVASTTSAADGSYKLSGIAPGTYTLTAAKQGFSSATTTVTVDAQVVASADLTLL